MASQREDTSRRNPGEGRACAESLQVEEAQDRKDKTPADDTPPRAGRTGKVGAKAERPADSRVRQGTEGAGDPARDRKAPSPAAKKTK